MSDQMGNKMQDSSQKEVCSIDEFLRASGNLSYEDYKRFYPTLTAAQKIQLRRSAGNHVLVYEDLEMYSLYVDAHEDLSQPEDTITLHSHLFAELLYCRAGNLTYVLGDRRYRFVTGDAILIPPGVTHGPYFEDEDSEAYYDRIVVWLRASTLSQIGGLLAEPERAALADGFVLHPDPTRFTYLRDLFSIISEEASLQRPGWQAAAAGLAVSLVVEMVRLRACQAPLPVQGRDTLDEILVYIDMNLGQNLSPGKVARTFHMSESTLNKLFRSHLHVSFYQYVLQRRMNEAKLKVSGREPITQIAQDLGFEEYSSFYRAFKKLFGVSPNGYRQLMRDAEQDT